MKKSILKQYARLVVRTGVNVQKGQEVIVHAAIDQGEFVHLVVKECYLAGASKVMVEWSDDELQKLSVKHQTIKTLGKVEKWQQEKLEWQASTLPAVIHIDSEDPDGMKGMRQDKLSKSSKLRYPIIKPYRDRMENRYQWTIVAVPSPAWAKKVFPNESKSQAMAKLWDAILYTSRVEEDAIANWKRHNEDLEARCNYLNSLSLESLHYRSSNGTDLTVGMIPEARFLGGGERTLGTNVYFNPNIPTEECFITPKKGVAEGIVYASKPLSYRGELIENFWFRFHEGKVVEAHAEKGDALLQQMISMDENAGYLGECALVPYDSPISNSGILFYNTLFDENAACHLALGMGFSNCIDQYEKYTKEQIDALGVNDSMIHVDFMIGCKDLEIVGRTHDGREVPIFKDGNWAF